MDVRTLILTLGVGIFITILLGVRVLFVKSMWRKISLLRMVILLVAMSFVNLALIVISLIVQATN